MLLASIALGPVGLSAAFAAGFISFISPCVWPLLPAYLSYVSGVAYADIGGETRRVTIATSCFVAGFTCAFALAGAGFGLLGGQFLDHRRTLEIVAGLLVIMMGVVLAGLAGTRFLQRELRVDIRHTPSGLSARSWQVSRSRSAGRPASGRRLPRSSASQPSAATRWMARSC